jgi:hypothetical protein
MAGVGRTIRMGAAVLLELRIIHEGQGKLYGQLLREKVSAFLATLN